MREIEFIESLRPLATDPAARALRDDAAVLDLEAGQLVLTCDLLIEGVHFRSDDPAEDVAWKLLAVNLSDLAAKASTPIGVLLGFPLGDDAWDRAFLRGLRLGLSSFSLPLLGGDTVTAPPGTPRTLALTALGRATGPVPGRDGARPGDDLWVTGTIGDGGAGLRQLETESGDLELIDRYRRPRPRLEAGLALGPLVSAMMDVSDGLLIDARRLSQASGCALTLDIGTVPLSHALVGLEGDGREVRMRAATAGDDYELLFTAPAEAAPQIHRLSDTLGLGLTRIGRAGTGEDLHLQWEGAPLELPERLGFEHEGDATGREPHPG